jgi:hypothetical protein
MKVSFKRLVGPEYMLPAMRVTTGKDMYTDKLPKLETWYKMLLSSHSSARTVKYRIFIEDIPYYAHVYLIRHHVGFEPHVFSQRDDKGELDKTDRDDKLQSVPISMLYDANAPAILNIAQKRLCYKSHRVIQDAMRKLKCAFVYEGDDYDKVLGRLMQRPCSWWQGYCSEPKPCGKVPGIKALSEVHSKVLEGM